MKYEDGMLILGQNDIFCGHHVVNSSAWFLQLTVFKDSVASHVTESGSLLTESGAVIKFSHVCSHPGTYMYDIYIYIINHLYVDDAMVCFLVCFYVSCQKHDDVIKWKHFEHYCPFVRGNFQQKGHWRGMFMYSLICAWITDWVNNRKAGDLRCHRA